MYAKSNVVCAEDDEVPVVDIDLLIPCDEVVYFMILLRRGHVTSVNRDQQDGMFCQGLG